MKHDTVCVAGTFDGLHKGHEAVLQAAFDAGKQVIIGLTSDEYVQKFKELDLRNCPGRKKTLEAWLKDNRFVKRAKIVVIDDPYGPSISANLDALIVTEQNKSRGEEINRIRISQGLKPLVLIEVPLVMGEDGEPLSSTKLRLTLPDSLRPVLQKPLGKVLRGKAILDSFEEHKNKLIITVGDVTTKRLLDAGIQPRLMIIDNQVNRKPYHGLDSYKNNFGNKVLVKSGPGFISQEAIKAIQATLVTAKSKLIEVSGEEDLLALPAILYAPIGTIVYYGQPKQGLVEVKVNKLIKKKAELFLQKFIA